MFFVTSKVLASLIQPATWLIGLCLVALWGLSRGRIRLARGLIATVLVLLLLMFVFPLGQVMLRPLEQAIRPPAQLPHTVDGIIVLGGTLNPELTAAYGSPQFGEDGERVTEMIALARKYPRARIAYSGASGSLLDQPMPETEVLKLFLAQQGVQLDVVLEVKSRNTYENAVFSMQLVKPQPGEKWLLVTSAFHMPRAYGTFVKAGWQVIPYPVSYRANESFSWGERDYKWIDLALKEWVGIAVYRFTGRM